MQPDHLLAAISEADRQHYSNREGFIQRIDMQAASWPRPLHLGQTADKTGEPRRIPAEVVE